MCAFAEWVLSRADLDPDAASCAIIVAMLLVLMIATVAIWAVWRVVYIKLWRWNRRKKKEVTPMEAKKDPLPVAAEQEEKEKIYFHSNIVSPTSSSVNGKKEEMLFSHKKIMKAIDYIRQKVAGALEIDPPDEVFRPALDKAMYKALCTKNASDPFFISLDYLVVVTIEYIQMDLLSVLRRKEMEVKINGTVSR